MFHFLRVKIALLPVVVIAGILMSDTQSAEAGGPVRMMHRAHMARVVSAPIVRSAVVRPRIVAPIAPVVSYRPVVVPTVRTVVPYRYASPVIRTPILYTTPTYVRYGF